MNKTTKIASFIFALMLIIFIHAEYSRSIIESDFPHCGLDYSFPNLDCELGWVMDDDHDGNVSFNITIFNNLDYAISDVFLIFDVFDYCSYTKYEKSIGGKSALNVQTPDFCSEDNFISNTFRLKYTDIKGEKKEGWGSLSSKVFDVTFDEFILRQEKGPEELKKHQHETQIIFISLVSLFFICWMVWQLKKKRNFDLKNLIISAISSSFLAAILTMVYVSFIHLLFAPTIYRDVQDFGSYFSSIFLNKIVLAFIFLVIFISIASWLYKNFFSNEMIIRKALLFLTIVSFVLATSETLVNQLYWDTYNSKGYLALFGFILGVTSFVINKFFIEIFIKKMIVYLIFTLILGILISGCTGNIEKGMPTYCEKHNCTYCEKDSDCTAIDFFEKMECCQSRFDKYIAINVNSFNEITKLGDRWLMWHCSFRKCKQSIVSAPLSFPEVRCINNICTPFATGGPSEVCTGNICTWNASWVKEQEELRKKRMGL